MTAPHTTQPRPGSKPCRRLDERRRAEIAWERDKAGVEMNLTEAVQILRDHNAWRLYDGPAPTITMPHDGKTIGQAIDLVCDIAPELLKACRQAIGAIKGREHDGFLRAVIAKAGGK